MSKSKFKVLSYNMPAIVAVSAALSLGFAVAAPGAGSAAKAEAAREQPVDASIGRLTELSRQVKVATLAKELRELQAPRVQPTSPAIAQALAMPLPQALGMAEGLRTNSAGPATGRNARGGAGSSGMAGMAGQAGAQGAATPTAAAAPQVAQTPAVASITGLGGVLYANMESGRRITTGDTVSVGGTRFSVTGITATGVSFDRCVGTQCTPVMGRAGG